MTDFDELLDQAAMGEPPADMYASALERLDSVVHQAIALSRRCGGLPSDTGRHYYASVLFTALVGRAVSLLQIAPLSNWAQKVIEHWDYASCSVIARTILEIRLCFQYLCVDPCSDVEWLCRWETMNLHDCAHRIKIFEALGRDSEAESLHKIMEDLAARISGNEHFRSLPPGKQRRITQGKDAYLVALEDIAVEAGMTLSEFRFFHVFFSTHAHGLPMSFYRIGEERGRGLPTEVESGYTTLCLSLTASLVAGCIEEIQALFEDAIKGRETDAEAASDAEGVPDPTEMMHGLEVGEVKRVHESGTIRIEAVGLTKTTATLMYFEPIMGEKVLRSIVNEDGELLAFVDPVYWNIDVNDEPVTDRLLDELLQTAHMFQIDVSARRLRFKAPVGELKEVRSRLTEVIKTEPQYPNYIQSPAPD